MLTEAIVYVLGGGGRDGIYEQSWSLGAPVPKVDGRKFLHSATLPCPLPLVEGKPHNPKMLMLELLRAGSESGVTVISHLAEKQVSYSIREVNRQASEGKPMRVCVYISANFQF